MKKYVLGIDGGGTKSHLGLFGTDGSCITTASWGPLNHEVMDGAFGQLESELSRFITGVLSKAGAGLADLEYSVFGLAGADTQAQHDLIAGILGRIGFPAGKFTLCNDGYLGVAAGSPDGAGICAINGTGSVITAIDHNGRQEQVGGIWGVTDDCGGSGWFGMEVLFAVYRELFKNGETTILTEMLFERLGVNSRDSYTEAVTTALDSGSLSRYTELNLYAFEAAGRGDKAAMNILEASAEHYAGAITWLARELAFDNAKPLYVTLAGSVFVKQQVKILPELIEKRVNNMLGDREAIFTHLEAPPVAGAVLWALRKAEAVINPEEIHKSLPAF